MPLFEDWFRVGPLGPYVAVPRNRFGWLTSLGLTLPALTYGLVGGGLGRILAGSLFAFVFGFSYAIAEETRNEGQTVTGGETDRVPSPDLAAPVEDAPLAA